MVLAVTSVFRSAAVSFTAGTATVVPFLVDRTSNWVIYGDWVTYGGRQGDQTQNELKNVMKFMQYNIFNPELPPTGPVENRKLFKISKSDGKIHI